MLEVVRGHHDIAMDRIIFHSGLRTQYSSGIVRDAFEGTIVWNATKPDCKHSISQVYTGDVKVHRRRLFAEDKDLRGTFRVDRDAIVMIEKGQPGKGGRYIGLVLRTPTDVCGTQCWTTQVKWRLKLLRSFLNFKSLFLSSDSHTSVLPLRKDRPGPKLQIQPRRLNRSSMGHLSNQPCAYINKHANVRSL